MPFDAVERSRQVVEDVLERPDGAIRESNLAERVGKAQWWRKLERVVPLDEVGGSLNGQEEIVVAIRALDDVVGRDARTENQLVDLAGRGAASVIEYSVSSVSTRKVISVGAGPSFKRVVTQAAGQ